jgi:Fe-S-cluster-containing hydrogenase component 2
LKPAQAVAADLSHPAIAVNLDACIQCTRCLRACRDEQGNDVIGLAFRGAHAQIVFDMGDAMGASTCVACGECVQACPTGALMPARGRPCWRARQAGRFGVPVLRRRLPADLPTSRTTTSSRRRAATARPTRAGCA